MIKQVIPVASPLVSFQVVDIQDDIYKTFGIGKPLPTLFTFGYVSHSLEPPFIDLPRPDLVDYHLTKNP